MTKVIGINCGYSGTVVEIPLRSSDDFLPGQEVVFKDEEGKEEYGVIKYVDREAIDKDKILFTSNILRRATDNDIQKIDAMIEEAKKALDVAKELAEKYELDISVFRAGCSFDGSKAHFMFTSDDRVDFRDLVKDLARTLKKQIHLKQVGPRDKAAFFGGYGKCGRELCCSSWLERLESITMEMVRVQAMESKGSSKLSGVCGKLLCCLKYEVSAYKDLKKKLPNIGERVLVKGKSASSATVIALDILNQKLKVCTPDGEYLNLEAGEIETKKS